MIAACAALLITGVLGDERGLTALQTGAFIGVLALAVAVRIIANQITVTQASESVRRALGEKEVAPSPIRTPRWTASARRTRP